ncbi:hypothetical protein BDAP_001432 [Binucleata daphniae]
MLFKSFLFVFLLGSLCLAIQMTIIYYHNKNEEKKMERQVNTDQDIHLNSTYHDSDNSNMQGDDQSVSNQQKLLSDNINEPQNKLSTHNYNKNFFHKTKINMKEHVLDQDSKNKDKQSHDNVVVNQCTNSDKEASEKVNSDNVVPPYIHNIINQQNQNRRYVAHNPTNQLRLDPHTKQRVPRDHTKPNLKTYRPGFTAQTTENTPSRPILKFDTTKQKEKKPPQFCVCKNNVKCLYCRRKPKITAQIPNASNQQEKSNNKVPAYVDTNNYDLYSYDDKTMSEKNFNEFLDVKNLNPQDASTNKKTDLSAQQPDKSDEDEFVIIKNEQNLPASETLNTKETDVADKESDDHNIGNKEKQTQNERTNENDSAANDDEKIKYKAINPERDKIGEQADAQPDAKEYVQTESDENNLEVVPIATDKLAEDQKENESDVKIINTTYLDESKQEADTPNKKGDVTAATKPTACAQLVTKDGFEFIFEDMCGEKQKTTNNQMQSLPNISAVNQCEIIKKTASASDITIDNDLVKPPKTPDSDIAEKF